MSDIGAFFLAIGIAFAGFVMGYGLEQIGEEIKKYADSIKSNPK